MSKQIIQEKLESNVGSGLVKAYIYTTLQCNLRCIHCNVGASPERKEVIELQYVSDFFFRFKDTFFEEVNITGGEPFLHKGISDICSIVQGRSKTVSLSTNGLVYNEKTILSIEGAIDYLNVSIDGDQKEHDHIRGCGIFNKVVENIINFSDHDVDVNINITENKLNYMYLNDFVCDLKSYLPINDVRIIPMMRYGRAITNWDQLSSRASHEVEWFSDNCCSSCTQYKSITLHPNGSIKKCYAGF